MNSSKFYDLDQAVSYLSQGIINIAKYPAKIFGVTGTISKIRLEYGHISSASIREINLDDEDVDLTPIPLGFLANKLERNVVSPYLQRVPARSWKIGLTPEHLLVVNPAGKKYSGNISQILSSNEFKNTVIGEYPRYREIIAYFKEQPKNKSVIAFSRTFALSEKNILYKCFDVPVGTVKNNIPCLEKEFSYLQEALNEAIK